MFGHGYVFFKMSFLSLLQMLQVFGDSHPYDFSVAYGHCDEDHAAEEKSDISSRESMKSKPFERLGEMDDIDKQMEQEFHEVN